MSWLSFFSFFLKTIFSDRISGFIKATNVCLAVPHLKNQPSKRKWKLINSIGGSVYLPSQFSQLLSIIAWQCVHRLQYRTRTEKKKNYFHSARAGYLKFSVDGEKSATSARTGITFVKHVHGKESTFCLKPFLIEVRKSSNYILVNVRIDEK